MAFVSIFAPLPAQIAVLGACISILAGLFIAYVEQETERERQRAELLEKLQANARPSTIFSTCTAAFANSLADLRAKHPDAILRQFAVLKLASVIEQAVRSLAEGVITFASTERGGPSTSNFCRAPARRFTVQPLGKGGRLLRDQPDARACPYSFRRKARSCDRTDRHPPRQAVASNRRPPVSLICS